jgi:O-antigen ligase
MKLLINSATKTFEPQLKQNESFTTAVDKYHNSVGLRMLWWNAGIRIWTDKPWIGHGDGSTRDQLAIQETKMPVEQGASTDGFIIVDPHSSILATAIDQGLVGVVLLVTFVLIAIVTEFTRNYSSRLLVGLGPAWILVTIFALFHTLQFSNYTASLISILVLLSLRRSAKSCALQNELD